MKNLLTIFFASMALSIFAQDIGFGFRTGLNFNRIQGDSEMNGDTELESFSSNTGFHVAATFNWKATDLMGLRGEIVYNQKGGKRSYEGPSYLTLTSTTNGAQIPTTGNRKQSVNLTTSYIDIPVVGYYRPFEKLEIFAGASLGFLVSAPTFGEVEYSGGMTAAGSGIEPFIYEIDGNYLSDNPGEAFFENPPNTVSVGGTTTAEVPASAGVYYEFDRDRGNLYRTIDLGAVAGLSIFLNGSLFISGRINYGLSDITKQEADVSLRSLDNGQFITRDDMDRNISIQTSIGFSF